jgi:O-antigen/teichoic acid export membrane protein
VSFIYGKIFHEKMSSEAMNFFSNLSYVGLGTFSAAIFSFIFNVLSGRLLGPEEYGEFNLIQSVAMFLYIPMLMGSHTSMVKYNSEKKEFHRQQKIISTTYILVFIQLLATIFLYRLFEPEILRILSISSTMFNFSIVFAVMFVFYTLSTETLRSLYEMKKYAILQPVFSIVLIICLYILYPTMKSSTSMIYSMYIAYGITSLITLLFIWRFIIINFEREWFIKLTKYSNYAFLGGLSFVLYSNIGSILINKYMQIEDVGIYRAYNYCFTTVIAMFISIFVTVFFPYASMCENKKILIGKINKIVLFLIVLGLPITIISGLLILKIYGGEYPFNPKLVLLSGFSGILVSIDTLYGRLMSSIGVKGIKIVSFASMVTAFANTLINLLLIPIIGIEGAILATIISYCVSILIKLSKRKYYNFAGYNAGN